MICRSIGATLLALTAALLSAGCGRGGDGYTWGSTFRPGVRSVAVPVFQTKSFSRGDEVALSQALVSQIESRTPYKVVPAERADTILEGTVVNVSLGTVSVDEQTALPQEQTYTIAVDFTWKDMRSGQILVERRNFEQTSTYYPTLGDGRFVGRQSSAEGLAASIVDQMVTDW